MTGLAVSREVKGIVPSPFESFLFLNEGDRTYQADINVDLFHFLFLVIHHETYFSHSSDPLERGCVPLSTDLAVYDVISRLMLAIRKGEPPFCFPIPFENTTPRLKGLSPLQKRHLEVVLIKRKVENVPFFLKNLDGISPYSPQVNKRDPWDPSLPRRELPCIKIPLFPVPLDDEEDEEIKGAMREAIRAEEANQREQKVDRGV